MEFLLQPNSDLLEWPKPGPDFDKQVEVLQKGTPYPHCQGSDNLSYRRLMVEILFPYYQDLQGSTVTEDRTIPYVGCVCPKALPAKVRVEVRVTPWENVIGFACTGRVRYAYINIVPCTL